MDKPLQDVVVLIAEDVPMNLLIMVQVMKATGATVVTATNGKAVLEVLEQQAVDAILMDLEMPELDGYETTQVIRYGGQVYKDIPVIAASAGYNQAEVDKCTAAGMNDWVTKPLNAAIVTQKILSCLHRQSSGEAAAEQTRPGHTRAYNLNYLRETTNNDPVALQAIVDNLAESGPQLLQEAETALAQSRWEEVVAPLHKLKGLVSLFFMPRITEALHKAESIAKTTAPNGPLILEQTRYVAQEWADLIGQIQEEMKN